MSKYMSSSFRLTALKACHHRLAVGVAALAVSVIGQAAALVDPAVAAEPTLRAQQPVPEKFLRSARPVPNHYIVVLKEDALRDTAGLPASSDGREEDGLPDEDAIGRKVEEVSEQLASAYNGRIGYVYKYTIHGFSVEMTEEQARALSEHPEVKYVEEETEASLQSSQVNAPWGLDRIDRRTLPLNGAYDYYPAGSKVYVYVIDTGIRFSHAEFGGRATVGADFAVPNDGKNGDDCNGHGTHVAGIIGGKTYGVAKNVRLISVRVAGCDGEPKPQSVKAAIDWVTKNHSKPAVVNMSLTARGTATADAIRASISKGITYVIAAGNNNGTSSVSVAEAIVVGANDASDVRPTWFPWCDAKEKNCGSNFGPAVDVFAPGMDIVSAWPDGVALAPYFQMVNTTPGSRAASMSGTSQAAPFVSGVAALHLQMSADPPAVIQQKITSQAVAGAVIDPGPGSPNRLLQTRLGGVSFADVDKDGRADAIVVGDNKITVRRSNGGTFGPNESWTTNPYFGNRGTFFADVTGDGRADAIAINGSDFNNNQHVTVRRSNGSVFLSNENWGSDSSTHQGIFFADVDNDDDADKIIVYDLGLRVRRSNGFGFGPTENWTAGPYYGTRGTFFADVDNDGMADAIVVGDNKITVRRSNGFGFDPNESWTMNPYFGSRGTFFADVTGDGMADAIVVNDDRVVVRRSTGSGFGSNESWTTDPYFGNRVTAFADIHGDGFADAIVVNDEGVSVRVSSGTAFHDGWFLPTGPYFGHW